MQDWPQILLDIAKRGWHLNIHGEPENRCVTYTLRGKYRKGNTLYYTYRVYMPDIHNSNGEVLFDELYCAVERLEEIEKGTAP